MANRDIAGLLTGIPSGGIDPRAQASSRPALMQSALKNQQRMAGGLRGMMGGSAPVSEQLALGIAKKEREESLRQKQAAVDVADALPLEYAQLAQAIRSGVKGALGKGIEILGRKQTEVEQPKGEKPTATDIKSAKKALSLAGEEAKGGEGFFAFLDTDWSDAWNNQTETAQDLLATKVAEVTNKLIDGGMDLSQARKLAIKKMYTDNLTETGLFEWGESRMMTPNEIAEKQKKDLEARLKNY
jgi:hypothetical protein